MAIYYQKMKPDDIESRVQNLKSLKQCQPKKSDSWFNDFLKEQFPKREPDLQSNTTNDLAANLTGAKQPVIIYYQSNAHNYDKKKESVEKMEIDQNSPSTNLIGVKLEFDSKDRVVVGEIYSPSNFFLIKVCSNQSDYDEMEKDMNEAYSIQQYKMKPLDQQTKLIGKNQFCAAYHQNRWRRIQVVHSDKTVTTCFLVDFGQIVEIETQNIYQLLPRFERLPPKSFRATLLYIDRQIWSLLETNFFKHLVDGKQLSIDLEKDDEPPKFIDVDYHYQCLLCDDDENINVALYGYINQNDTTI